MTMTMTLYLLTSVNLLRGSQFVQDLLLKDLKRRQVLRERSSLERIQGLPTWVGKTVDQKPLTNRDRDTRIQDVISVLARVVHQAALVLVDKSCGQMLKLSYDAHIICNVFLFLNIYKPKTIISFSKRKAS